MAHVERTLTTTTDIHTVWDYLTDFRTTFKWSDDDDADLENVSGVVEAFRSRFGG